MTKLLIIRHGQSEANLQGVFVGHTNSPLSDLGRRQAEATADYIVSTYRVDAVYASDLERAFYTGKAVADRLGLPVTPVRGMREIFAGDWETVKFDTLSTEYGEPYQLWLRDIGLAHPTNGESTARLQQRIGDTLRTIAEENEGKTVVVATHATPIRTFMHLCTKLPLSEMKNIPWVSNASVTTAVYENGSFTIVEAGHDAHLGDMRTALPKNV
ncbi:MAG: histidine phosphatase family protein [Oscillospiraceae bacterium]|nr:histidine phosphatase family protein [Oscillospiraceae bacterium]